MSRTVVTFVGRTRTFVMLDDANVDIALEDLSEVNLASLPQETLVQHGEALFTVLGCDTAVKQGLSTLLLNPLGSAPAPIYFRIRAATADLMGWEQLYADTKGFLALDRRWPIGRIARQRRALTARVYDPPLRLVAVLAAAGQDGHAQLNALVVAAATAPVPVRLHAVVGDDGLLRHAGASGVSCERISPSGPGLMRQIAAANPDVLHLLCHGGGSAGGEKRLMFAHPSDFDAAQLDRTFLGSVPVSVSELAATLLPVDPWLVVLAACRSGGAEGTPDGLALAHDLASGGIPAVIGMRRLVDITATDNFSREFYPEAFAVVRRAIGAAGPAEGTIRRTVDWAEALTGPRQVLSGGTPESVDSWTDPVLYAQDGILEIVVPTPDVSPEARVKIQGTIDKLKGGLAVALASDAGPGLLDELQRTIADLESQLR